ncbi:MAG: hypothetical protein ACI89L_000962 [Phycisphaerales bacterium]|jgi:hypothetical protein
MTRSRSMGLRTALVVGCAAVLAGGLMGCRVERTRGQRHQIRAIESVMAVEAQRLTTLEVSQGTLDEYRHLVSMYQDILNATLRSAWAQPTQVQQAEDSLLVIADEVRSLRAYQAMHPDTQVNYERQFWRNRLQPWQMWRGPGFQTNREQWDEKLRLNWDTP